MSRRDDCRLRPLSEGDLEIVLRWRNSDRVRANMYTDHIITWQEHKDWFCATRSRADVEYLVFEYLECPTGMVYFTAIDRPNGKCQWGFYIGEEGPPRGKGAAMGYVALEHAFEAMKIRKLCGEVLAFNAASLNFFRKLGFTEEGRLARHVLKNCAYIDVVLFGMFIEDWRNGKQTLKSKIFSEAESA